MTILRKFRTLRSLGPDGMLLTIEALILTAVVSAGFGLIGVPRTQKLLRRWASSKTSAGGRVKDIGAEIRMARRAQRIVHRNAEARGSCLSRSLVLWALLERRGVETVLRVGFRKQGGTTQGHAWVERHGVPLNEDADVATSYTVSDALASFDVHRK